TGDPSRPTLVMVHGYPDNSSVWDGVVEILRDSFHVVRYDVRGTGQSSAPANRAGYRLDRLAADLAAVVRAVGDGPVHILAHDWGSLQAWHAVTDPDYARLFSSFTSISGPCLDHVAAWMRERFPRRPVLDQLVRSWYVAVFQIPVLPGLLWRLPWFRRKFSAQARDAVHGLELYRANIFCRHGHRQQRYATLPVQQLVLTDDAYVRPAMVASADPWCTRLWRRELHTRHWAPRERPVAVAAMTAEFVDYIEGMPASRGLRRAAVGAEYGPFEDRLVLVTGAGRGVPRATALAFGKVGADVLVVDPDPDAAAATVDELHRVGARGIAYRLDVTDDRAVPALADAVLAEHGTPDIVVVDAGFLLPGGLLDTSAEDWQRVFGVQTPGVLRIVRVFAQQLVARAEGGHLVIVGDPAVRSLVDRLRDGLARYRIGVTAVLPTGRYSPDKVAASTLRSVRRNTPAPRAPASGR
ncbi:MAG: SDR family oxidoreductase, partial [Sciscionella sp.]